MSELFTFASTKVEKDTRKVVSKIFIIDDEESLPVVSNTSLQS